MPMRLHPATFQRVLLLVFTVYFVLWLHDPPYELHAIIHVVPTWLAIAILLASTKFCPLSNASFACLILFLILHVLGTRYVYSFVPYEKGKRTGIIPGLACQRQLVRSPPMALNHRSA